MIQWLHIDTLTRMATPLIITIIVIRAVAINRLPKRAFKAFWSLALARLLLPVTVPSPVSMQRLIAWLSGLVVYTPQATGTALQPPAAAQPTTQLPSDLPFAGTQTVIPQATVDHWLLMAWLLGALLCGGYFLVVYVRSKRRFAASLPAQGHPFLADWLAGNGIRRRVQIRQLDTLSSPLTYGILRPVILLPKTSLSLPQDRLAYILTHEMTHIRCFDALQKALLALALCLHWFNPLVWAMYILANRDIELACDERVVRRYGETLKSAYALTLLSMEQQRGTPGALQSHFSKYAIEERINAIMKSKKTGIFASCLALTMVIVLAIVFATSASAGETPTGITTTAAVEDTVQWYTYDEYKTWVETQRDALQSLVGTGAQSWSPTLGVFEWTQAQVDDTIAEYEATLQQISEGMLVSKPDAQGNMIIAAPRSAAMLTEGMQDVSAVYEVTDSASTFAAGTLTQDIPAQVITESIPAAPAEAVVSLTRHDVLAPAEESIAYSTTVTEAHPATVTFRSTNTQPAYDVARAVPAETVTAIARENTAQMASVYSISETATETVPATASIEMAPVTFTVTEAAGVAVPAGTPSSPIIIQAAPVAETYAISETTTRALPTVASVQMAPATFTISEAAGVTTPAETITVVTENQAATLVQGSAQGTLAAQAAPSTVTYHYSAPSYDTFSAATSGPSIYSSQRSATAASDSALQFVVETEPGIAAVTQGAPTVAAQAVQVTELVDATDVPSFSASIAFGEKLTTNLGPYETHDALREAIYAYCDSLVRAGIVSQAQVDAILAAYQ